MVQGSLSGTAFASALGLSLLLAPWGVAEVQAEEVSASARTAAESLFQTGRALMEKEDYERACRAFEESNRLDSGVGTLLNLGRCYELSGRVASAWSTFAEAEASARRDGQVERASIAKRNKERLTPLVPHVVIVVEELRDETLVRLDGVEIAHATMGLPLAVDPGQHSLEVEEPGATPWSLEFLATVGQQSEPIQLSAPPRMNKRTREKRAAYPELQTSAKASPISPPEPAPQVSSSYMKPVGVVTAVAGGIAAGLGTGLVVHAYAKASSAECEGSINCTEAGVEQREEAKEQLPIGYAVGISGFALLGAGILIYRLAPSETDASFAVEFGGSGGFTGLTFERSF